MEDDIGNNPERALRGKDEREKVKRAASADMGNISVANGIEGAHSAVEDGVSVFVEDALDFAVEPALGGIFGNFRFDGAEAHRSKLDKVAARENNLSALNKMIDTTIAAG